MSMSSSFIYGYGFELTCIDENIISFVKNHKDSFCKSDYEKGLYEDLLNYIEKENTLDDFFADYFCDTSGREGNGAVISNIMQRETGISFQYECGDEECGSHPSVLLAETCPWYYNKIEKSLTEGGLNRICKKYMKELGIQLEPKYLGIEYYG